MAKRNFSPRAMMEKAIEVMLQLIAEPRADGKASPKVGAVLILSLERALGMNPLVTASRGELREGDHAEFTLLERKCRDCKPDGSVLFATLELCAPGARRHPKLGCAERIVLARIKEVWVGIEDPDPTVDRKGIKYLQDNGVTVHMFERDLQEKIREANKDFIAQAMERAAAAQVEKQQPPIVLSPLENAFARAVMNDFSTDALERYREVAKITDAIASPAFYRRLALQGLLKEENGQWCPRGSGCYSSARNHVCRCRRRGCLARFTFRMVVRTRKTLPARKCSHPNRRCNGGGTSYPIRWTGPRHGGSRSMRLCSSWPAKGSGTPSSTAITASKGRSAN